MALWAIYFHFDTFSVIPVKIRFSNLPNLGFRKGLFRFGTLYIFGYPDFLAICMLADAFFWHLKVCSKVKSKPTFYWYEYLMTWNLNADLPWKLLGQDKRYKFATAETNFPSNFEKKKNIFTKNLVMLCDFHDDHCCFQKWQLMSLWCKNFQKSNQTSTVLTNFDRKTTTFSHLDASMSLLPANIYYHGRYIPYP